MIEVQNIFFNRLEAKQELVVQVLSYINFWSKFVQMKLCFKSQFTSIKNRRLHIEREGATIVVTVSTYQVPKYSVT